MRLHTIGGRGARVGSVLLLSSLTFVLSTCRRAGPELNVGVSPRYPCSGEAVTVTFSLNNIDKVEVKDARGTVITESAGRSGAVTIPKINQKMLPLVATGWKGGASRSQHIPGDIPLGIIDGTLTTESFPLNHRMLSREDRPKIATQDCGCILDDDEPVICANAASIYEVNGTYDGQDGALDSAWFSARSRVVGMLNDSAIKLTYYHDGNRLVSVPSQASQIIDYDSDVMPSGTWGGKYDPTNLDVQHRGTYIDGGKVCSGWIHRRNEDPTRQVSVRLLLRCMK